MTPRNVRRAEFLLGERLADTPDRDGPSPGKGDAPITATALERDEPVLAADTHFDTIPGIRLKRTGRVVRLQSNTLIPPRK